MKKKVDPQDNNQINVGLVGLGLRTEYYSEILNSPQPIDWLEIISENYLIPGGKPLYFLDAIRERYPMVMHGVSLSIGSTDPIDWNYLRKLKELIARVDPLWVSDHLCWTGVNGLNMHDLLPLPYTDETIHHVVNRLNQVQDFLGRPVMMENVSSYIGYKSSNMTEWQFLNSVVEASNTKILLDINNIYVSAYNHGFDASEYLDAIPKDRVQQFHLAGHRNFGDHIIDTHDSPIIDPVWILYERAIARFGNVPTLIERDGDLPPLSELLAEVVKARRIMEQYENQEASSKHHRSTLEAP